MNIPVDPSKYVTLPVQNEKIWRKYQTTLDWFWTIYDIYLANDRDHADKSLKPDQRQYILELLAFMYASHYAVVNKELFMQLINQVNIKEAVYYFGSQADAKKTHSMMYSLLLDELLANNTKAKEQLLSDVISRPPVRNFIRWAIHSTTSNTETFPQRLLAFASLQGIVFNAHFALVKWFLQQHESLMPGLKESNDFIWRDEKLNFSFSCSLFEYIDEEITEEEAHAIVKSSVAMAIDIFTSTLAVSKLGMECDLMKQFIEHSADKLLTEIRVKKLYNKECPFDWLEEPVTDTYQNRLANMSSASMSETLGEAKFDTDVDF